tara:strand:- start:774 stop:1982 length:1209 start_codon:yes stop_codon:yes gene_type:complete
MDKFPVSKRASNIEYAIRDVVVPANKLEKNGYNILKLNIGDPLEYSNFKTPQHMITAFNKALMDQNNGYSSSYGIDDLRISIAKYESNNYISYKYDDVYICHGVTEALQIIFASFLENGDKILSPGPHYPPYMAYPQLFGAETIEYRLNSNNGWDVDLDDLESKMDDKVRIVVLINPNNPTGSILSKKTIINIIEIVSKWPNCIIVSDEIYNKIIYDKKKHYPTATLSKNVPVITLNGVSKNFFAPGWRIGYMIWHDPHKYLTNVRDGVERLLRSRLCASTPAQIAYLSGLNNSEEWRDNYLSKLYTNRNYCIERINNNKFLNLETPYGAFYMFVKINHKKYSKDDKSFALNLLNEQKVLIVHGSGFSKKYGSGHFRLVYLADILLLEESFDKIDLFLNNNS